MFRPFSRFQPIIFGVIFLGFWAANAFQFHSEFFGAALAVVWVVMCGREIGKGASPGAHPALQTWLGAWLLLSGVSLAGAAVYYATTFTADAAFAIILLSVPISLWIGRGVPPTLEKTRHRIPWAAWFAAAGALASLALVLKLIANAATTEPIRSAWVVVNPSAFVALFFAFLLLGALLMRGQERMLALPLSVAALFVFLAVATLVFPLGFGFDPFIHRATVEHIATFGTITPKPLYYVGQYALQLIAFHGFSLPIELVDRWLLPILAALLLPFAWYAAARSLTPDRRVAVASLAAIFLLPLGSFIATTPQGLANLWTLLLVLATVPAIIGESRPRIAVLAVGAVATAVIHPIAGLPALLFITLAGLHSASSHKKITTPLFWVVAALGCFVLPASFVANALRGGFGSGLDLSAFTPAAVWEALHLDLFLQNGFRPLLDFAYLYGGNVMAIVLILSVIGWWIARRRNISTLPYVVFAVALAFNYLLLSTAVDFSFLIDYERQNYAERLLPLIVIALSPLVILGVTEILRRVRVAPVPMRVFAVVLLAGAWTAAWYMAYPRHDAFEVGHGINTSQSDVNAVYEIDRVANGVPYAVLANQSVSAAAVRSLGFAHYYGDQFFYPIPTGSPLYQVFLDMNDRPTRETVQKAFDLMPVDTVFFVVNDYWWQSDRIVETAKTTADSWFAIDQGAITVFRYDQSSE